MSLTLATALETPENVYERYGRGKEEDAYPFRHSCSCRHHEALRLHEYQWTHQRALQHGSGLQEGLMSQKTAHICSQYAPLAV